MLKIHEDWVVEARMGVLSVFAESSPRGWGSLHACFEGIAKQKQTFFFFFSTESQNHWLIIELALVNLAG